MKILALDTSSNACSVALVEGNQQNYTSIDRFEVAPRQHTQLILPMIDSVLHTAGYDINDIDVLAFGHGPGAFTGVRVATGVIQAIAYGADLPVASVSSLAALAQALNRKNNLANKVLVANDARMDEVYFAAYEMYPKGTSSGAQQGFMTLMGKEHVIKPQNLQTVLDKLKLDNSWQLTGCGWSVYKEHLSFISRQCAPILYSDTIMSQLSYPDAKDIAYLAFKEIANNTLVKAEQVSPVYLRNNVAKKAKK